jgi:hypothetical protein
MNQHSSLLSATGNYDRKKFYKNWPQTDDEEDDDNIDLSCKEIPPPSNVSLIFNFFKQLKIIFNK